MNGHCSKDIVTSIVYTYNHGKYFSGRSYALVVYPSIKYAGERGGSVVECRIPEREVRGSKPTAAVLCP